MAKTKPGPNSIDRKQLERLIFKSTALRRFTQDSPILPDVWFAYGTDPAARLDLLLTPNRKGASNGPGELFGALMESLDPEANLAYNQSTVAARLTFRELVRHILPLAVWRGELGDVTDAWMKLPAASREERIATAKALSEFEAGKTKRLTSERPPVKATVPTVLWAIRIIGTIELALQGILKAETLEEPLSEERALLLVDTVAGMIDPKVKTAPLVYSASRNREASVTVFRSVATIKADAARGLFPVDFQSLRWAVIDSGIDARHPAFRKREYAADETGRQQARFFAEPFELRDGAPVNNTRIVETYDFTATRELTDLHRLENDKIEDEDLRKRLAANPDATEDLIETLRERRPIRWTRFLKLLQVPHNPTEYAQPLHEHGTHVAGILAGDWRRSDITVNDWRPQDHDLIGVCPELQLYDLRVLDSQGNGNEFAVSAAIQFLQGLTTEVDYLTVQGVNMSLAIQHDVANFACGRTPVCEDADRLIDAGVVVVTAAGNEGYLRSATDSGEASEGYRTVSITDPGNSESVITVGSTHGYRPYEFGVSYFSSRGPTGDGRAKPDLVAPGEKIWSAAPDGGVRTLDGTSQATPHVSGCAALLMARYHELIGDPARVKQILCSTASDLGRERYFQGHGMVDVLRAMQSI